MVGYNNIMNKVYYINYNSNLDDSPHYGEYDSDIQVMDTGKVLSKSFQKEKDSFQDAKNFLLDTFRITWIDEPEILVEETSKE